MRSALDAFVRIGILKIEGHLDPQAVKTLFKQNLKIGYGYHASPPSMRIDESIR